MLWKRDKEETNTIIKIFGESSFVFLQQIHFRDVYLKFFVKKLNFMQNSAWSKKLEGSTLVNAKDFLSSGNLKYK